MVTRMRVGVVDVGGGVREGGGSRGLGVCGGLCCVRVCVCVCTDGRQTKNTWKQDKLLKMKKKVKINEKIIVLVIF